MDFVASNVSMRTVNPIRMILDSMKMTPNPFKETIPLSIGDPSLFGNLDPHPSIKQALSNAVLSGKGHGYGHSTGFQHARAAVAQYASLESAPLEPKDVFLACGASGALDLAITVIANGGDNILIPRPGFSLYVTICEHRDIEPRFYRLDPENLWQIDLADMESKIDKNTKAILINNPSNPCGSVFSKEHLSDILSIAERHHLPIIADEIYEHMVFAGHSYHSVASVAAASASFSKVPILAVGGIAKRFLVPGWRLGWLILHDRENLCAQLREGIFRLTTVILGPNTHVQDALHDILLQTPQEFYSSTIRTLQDHAMFSAERLGSVAGLRVVIPQGSLYMMVQILLEKFADFSDDIDFAEKLVKEESVFVLPATCFGAKNYFRIVFCAPKEKLSEAFDRIAAFCERHLLKQ